MQIASRSPRGLISTDLFGRLVGRVEDDEQVNHQYAERVVEQTLVFLTACANTREVGLSPTKAVDAGWHAFILHTQEYAEFCHRIAGRFIHHRPRRDEHPGTGSGLVNTAQALRQTGYAVDGDLWRVDAADCHQCHAGCHDSP